MWVLRVQGIDHLSAENRGNCLGSSGRGRILSEPQGQASTDACILCFNLCVCVCVCVTFDGIPETRVRDGCYLPCRGLGTKPGSSASTASTL